MSVELLLSIFAAAASIVYGFYLVASWAVKQFEKRLDERFERESEARKEGRLAWDKRFHDIESKYSTLDSDVRRILIELPRDYVTRADYIRRETVIEAKIDQLSLRIENWLLKREAAS